MFHINCLSSTGFSCLLDLLSAVIPPYRKSYSLKVCTIISDFTPSAALAASMWNPLGVVSTRLTSFLGSKLLIMPGVNERTEERASVASQGAPCEGDKAYSGTVALSASGSAQMKRGQRKNTEHKACMLMCQLSKLARGWIKLLHL